MSLETHKDSYRYFEAVKYKLNKIFFRQEDFIVAGSKEYRNFWIFLQKYYIYEEKHVKAPCTKKPSMTPNLKIPSHYDKQWTISFTLLPTKPKDLLNRISFQDRESVYEEYLSKEMVSKFQSILCLYLDFLQKQKFEKLKKLRQSQRDLPIYEYRKSILQALSDNSIIIIAGDTGCGKSTQIPQYLMSAGYNKIAVTQPRRIACIALSNRVGYENLNSRKEIGYQIRFEKKANNKTKVLFITEGLLLRQISGDHKLSSYDVIILDEVHERHLHGDFLLGAVKCLIHQRPKDLKVILMSATINIKLFQEYFEREKAPVIQVPGRLHPIALEYHPIQSIETSSSSEKLNPAPYIRILQNIDHKIPVSERGDVLIFLPGIKEITAVCDAVREYNTKNNRWIVLPLHSTLSLKDQDQVFDYAPQGFRKCIISTNIAETSVTIDGIRFVIDSGKVKEMTYDPTCKLLRLKEFWISRASAEQRKGRAGRTGPGICYRLYSENEYKDLLQYSTPEIQRVSLDGLILQMVSMGLPDARKFPFIEPPSSESLENSIMNLKEQGAMLENEQLTIIGQTLAKLPVDVSIGKMLIIGSVFNQIESALSLAAALSVQSPFTNDAYRDADCIASRRNLDSEHGDPITLLNAYKEWLHFKAGNGDNSRKWCRNRGLEEQRFYEMTKLRNQFKELLESAGLLEKEDESVTGLTSVERASRHGELRHLKSLKRDWHKKNSDSRKKVLKSHSRTHQEREDDEEEVDIKDIEFRIKHDRKQVRNLIEGSQAVTYKDLNILKVILCSGLYPQFALADEFNSSQSSELYYHTKVKPFNVLHPNSFFAFNSEYITLDKCDIVSHPESSSKYPVSSKHQLLVYTSLLETNKPYLINTLRVPALPVLLLFCQTIDVNGIFSKIIFDSWIECNFIDYEQAQNLTLKAVQLRRIWSQLLNAKLSSSKMEVQELKALEETLSEELLELLHTEISFSIKRLLPGDLKILYFRTNYSEVPNHFCNPFDSNFIVRVNESKGGLQLTDYLLYDCIELTLEESRKCFADHQCSFCSKTWYGNTMSRIKHLTECSEKESLKKKNHKLNSSFKILKFSCEYCQESYATTIELLKHKKNNH